jgi:hypothetical protein
MGAIRKVVSTFYSNLTIGLRGYSVYMPNQNREGACRVMMQLPGAGIGQTGQTGLWDSGSSSEVSLIPLLSRYVGHSRQLVLSPRERLERTPSLRRTQICPYQIFFLLSNFKYNPPPGSPRKPDLSQ